MLIIALKYTRMWNNDFPIFGLGLHLKKKPFLSGMNGTGSYTPLRVYHNSKSKKGHFRY